jgi:coenzyme PQQ precursor peptide PqqA
LPGEGIAVGPHGAACMYTPAWEDEPMKLRWTKPTVREIACGYEINAYASAERRPTE